MKNLEPWMNRMAYKYNSNVEHVRNVFNSWLEGDSKVSIRNAIKATESNLRSKKFKLDIDDQVMEDIKLWEPKKANKYSSHKGWEIYHAEHRTNKYSYTQCPVCLNAFKMIECHLHHLIPKDLGRHLWYDVDNLQPVCKKCHAKIHPYMEDKE